jgi:hypothetical protein
VRKPSGCHQTVAPGLTAWIRVRLNLLLTQPAPGDDLATGQVDIFRSPVG